MHLYLIGYMGSGKTTLGKKIAQRTGWSLLDLDKYFEESYRTSIPLFFDRYGEEAFREIERKLLTEVAGRPGQWVVSTGGGTPCHPDNLEIMKHSGSVIYLKLPPAALVSRLLNSPLRYKRPILKGLDKDELLAKITCHLLEREIYYGQADLVIESFHLNANEIMGKVFENFPQLEEPSRP